MQHDWHREFFQGIAVELWHQAAPPAQTVLEVDFAWLELGLAPGSRVLDVPCGHGRHAVELARRGAVVTGVDLSADALALARAGAAKANVPVAWRQADVSEAVELPPCDAAITLGNSFGYFGPAGLPPFVRSVARALKPGGRWLIDTGMVAESILVNLKPTLQMQIGDIGFHIENEYLAGESCLHTTFTFTRNGQSDVREIWHWVFTVGEIRRLLADAGLRTVATYSSLTRESYQLGSHCLYLVSEKP
jgi:SAM-dependent methyltransferase